MIALVTVALLVAWTACALAACIRLVRRAEDAAKNAAEAADIAVRAARSAQAVANKTYFDRQGSAR